MALEGQEEPHVELQDKGILESLGSLEILEICVDLQVVGGFVFFGDNEVLGDLDPLGDLQVIKGFGEFGDNEALAGLEAFGDLETMEV